MMNGSQKVYRETCEHCKDKYLPDGCKGCLVPDVYDYLDECRHKTYYREYANLGRAFKEKCNLRDAKYYKYHGRRR